MLRRRRTCRGLVVGAVLLAVVPSAADVSRQPGTLALRVELIEQAACLVSRESYRVSFEMRTFYVNHGGVPVSIDLGAERIVRASFTPADEAGAEPDVTLAFAMPAGMPTATDAPRGRTAVAEPGWAVSGRTVVWVPLSGEGSAAPHSLMPGGYTARFEMSVLAADRSEGAAGATPFQLLRLSTPPLLVNIGAPGQVQECGSFSLPLPPAS